VRPGRRRRTRASSGGASSTTPCPVRGVARRSGRPRGSGVGPHRRGRDRLFRGRAGRGSRLRRPGRTGAASPRATAAVGHRVRDRRGRVRGGRGDHRRWSVAAPAGRHRGDRAAVAGGGRHGRRLRLLVHGCPAHRRGARHALLGSRSRRRRLHGAACGHGRLRGRAGRGKRPGGPRSRPRIRRVGPRRGTGLTGRRRGRLSGCRRG
jgi:hypothetical protein